MHRLIPITALLLVGCFELPPPKEPHAFPIRSAEGDCRGRACNPPALGWMGPTSDLGDPNPWVDQPAFDTGPESSPVPECDEHSAYDPLFQRCRPVVGPRAACHAGPFATDHPWAAREAVKRYIAVGGSGDGQSPESPAPSATVALDGVAADADITLLYGAGTFEEGLAIGGSGRVVTLVGLCPSETHLSGGDQIAVQVDDVARLRVAGLHLSSEVERSPDSFREGALAVFGAGGIELSELMIESTYTLGITIYDVGARGVHLSSTSFGRTNINSFAVVGSAGPVTIAGSDFRGPNWGWIVNILDIAGDVTMTHNYVGASASRGVTVSSIDGDLRFSNNEVAGPLGELGLYVNAEEHQEGAVNIEHNRFDQVGGSAVTVAGGAGPLNIAFNQISGPIAHSSIVLYWRGGDETQRLYRNTIGWVGHSGIGIDGVTAPIILEGNRIDGPVGSYGIAAINCEQTSSFDILRNHIGQTGENAIRLRDVGQNIRVFQNRIVGPTGAAGILIYNQEQPDPPDIAPELVIGANAIGDVSEGDGILLVQLAHNLRITDNDLSGPFAGAGISVLGGIGAGRVVNNTVGRAYQHGMYLGTSWSNPDLYPTGSWEIHDNRFLGPIGLDGICVYKTVAPDGGGVSIEGNEIGRAARTGIIAQRISGSLAVNNNTMLGPIGHDGIYIGQVDGSGQIEGNEIQSGQRTGISLRGESTTGEWSVSNNEISDVLGRGVLLYDLRSHTDVAVEANTITGSRGAGIYAWASTAPINIQSNNLSRTRQAGFVDMVNGSPELVLFGYGVAALDVVSLNVSHNTISDNHVGGLAVDHAEWGSYDNAPHLAGTVTVHIEGNELSGHPSHQEIGMEQNVVVQNRAGDMNITGVQGLGSMNPVGLEVPMCRNVGGAHQAAGGGGF